MFVFLLYFALFISLDYSFNCFCLCVCVLLCALPGRHFYTRAWPLSNTCALFFRFQVFAVCSLLMLAVVSVVVATAAARRTVAVAVCVHMK